MSRSALLSFVVGLLIAVFATLVPGVARAATADGCTGDVTSASFSCDTRVHAYSAIAANIISADQYCTQYFFPNTSGENQVDDSAEAPPATGGTLNLTYICHPGGEGHNVRAVSYFNNGCNQLNAPVEDEWSANAAYDSFDPNPNGGTTCFDQCALTLHENAKPDWRLELGRWHVQVTGTPTGTSCATVTLPPSWTPPTPPPDDDHDGIPNDKDPYPNDPGNSPPPPPPPPPPPDPPPPPPPPPPTGDGGATSSNIGDLQKAIVAAIGTLDTDLSAKLDALQSALGAIKAGEDINSATNSAALSQLAGAISQLAGIGGGSATDMGPTNAILTGIHTDTTAIASSAADVASTLHDLSGQTHKDALTEPTAGEGDAAWASGEGDAGSGLDDAGMGFSRTCPANPTMNVFGHAIVIDTSPLCTWMGLGGLLVLALAGILSIRIISAGVN